MINITDNGIVTLGGLRFCEETRMRDVEAAPSEVWEFTKYKAGNAFLSLMLPAKLRDVLFRVDVFFPSETASPQITLHPLPADEQAPGYTALEAFQASREWLKAFMYPTKPVEETDQVVGYDLPWGYVYTMIVSDRDYGFRGGEVEIRFERHAI